MKKLKKISLIGCSILTSVTMLSLNVSADSQTIFENGYSTQNAINSEIAPLSLNADFTYNGGAYRILDSNNVTFMGVSDSSIKSFSIPSRALDAANKKYYQISQIGYPNASMPGANSGLMDIETIDSVPGSVTVINKFAFYGSNLKSINLSNLNGLTNITYCAFACCTQLETVMLPCYMSSIDGSAFAGCKSLTNFTIYSDGKGECWLNRIGPYAFADCSSLRRINIPFTSSLTIDNYALSGMGGTSSNPVVISLGSSINNYYYGYITVGSSEIQLLKNKTLVFSGNLSRYFLKDTDGNDLNWNGTLK